MTNLTHNSFLYMSISILYMFRASKCSSSRDSIVSIRYLVYSYVTLAVWYACLDGPEFHPNLHTRRSPTKSDMYQISY